MHIVASTGLLLIVLGFSGGAWYVWERTGDALIPAGRYLVFLGGLSVLFSVLANWLLGRGFIKRTLFLDARVWAVGLLAIFFSDWMNRPWGLFKGPGIRGELLVMCVAFYLLLRSGKIQWLITLPIISVALLIWSFLLASDGKLLFSDDHAMFIFRLKLLQENFPSIPFWSPLWNAGFDARDFFATGALNAFLIAAPLLYVTSVETLYPYLISFLVWILPVGSVLCAARIVGLSWLAAALAATLSVSSSLFWYRWALKYGTVGFITSTALFPLVVALAIRVLRSEKPRVVACVVLSLLTTLMLLWSPSGIAALPVAVCALPLAPRLLRSKRHLLTLVLIVALNLPWMAMMWKVSKVGRFLSAEQSHVVAHTTTSSASQPDATPSDRKGSERVFRHEAGGTSGKKVLAQWHSYATSLNPLVLICAVPALMALPLPLLGYFTVTVAWLALLGTVGVSLKPQLELDRMLLVASMLCAIPIGRYLAELLDRASDSRSWCAAASVLGAFLLIGPCAAASVVLNRGDDHYFFADADVRSMVQAIHDNAESGRVLFSGCVLHELSGGHLGPLPLWTDTPMIASSYAHNIWRYEQPIPQTLLEKGDSGIVEFLNLTNTTLVAAHEPTWIDYFRHRPQQYAQLWRGDRFFLFKRLDYASSYTVDGSLEQLSFTSNSVTLTPTSETLTLKLKFFPFLTSSGCSLQPAASSAGIDLIKLVGCKPNERITISSVSPLTRLVSSKL